MRSGLVLLVVASSTMATTAAALGRPRPPPPRELRDPFESRRPCNQKNWAKVRACLERDHVRVTPLYEVDGAKLVGLVTEGAAATPLRLYVQSDGEPWRQASIFGINNASSELLAFKRLDEHRYRIDQGMVIQTGQRIWLRRQLTTLCTDTVCRTIVTACDAFTDGKSSGTFRGTLYAQGAALFVVGDKSRAGSQCAPSPSIVRSEPVGDLLE
jgi:hypothetical protein